MDIAKIQIKSEKLTPFRGIFSIIAQSKLGIKYNQPIDRVSAYEQLMQMKQQAEQEVAEDSDKTTPTSAEHSGNTLFSKILKSVITALTATFASILGTAVSNKVTGKKSRSRTSTTERAVKNATSAATRTMTREITRSILGNLVK
ncbi:helicase HerA-like domain-containing protein [Prevotella disiens]